MPYKKKDKEKIETENVDPTKVSLPLSVKKSIKSWYDIITTEDAEIAKASQIQQWIDSISETLELLKTIQNTLKPPEIEK